MGGVRQMTGFERAWRGLVAIFAISLVFLGLGSGGSVAAQEGGGEVSGSLLQRNEEGERVGVAGVTFRAFDESGAEVSSTTTAEDGSWSMTVPEGTYDILLDVDTLPDGVSLRNPDKNPASVTLIDGSSKSALFPLGEAAASSVGGNTVIQLIVDGLKLGLIIAMCAIGLSLIYGTTGLTNFAHGEAVTFGAVMAYLLNNAGVFGVRLHLIPATVIVVAICGGVGGLFNRAVWRPMRRRGASLVAALVVSIGFSIFFRYVILFIFSGRAKRLRDYQIQEQWDLGLFRLAPKDLV
ncbi:MAG: ABC transporter permease subunit, partial [Ilumatobacteraceae bacterium]